MDPVKEYFQHKKTALALLMGTVLLLSAFAYLLISNATGYKPTESLPEDYIILVEYPRNEGQRTFTACLAPLTVHEGYHPIFVLNPDGSMDRKAIQTLEDMGFDGDILLFASSSHVKDRVEEDVGPVKWYRMQPDVLKKFRGFQGYIEVGSYREALWVAPYAAEKKMLMVPGESTYHSQRQVWDAMRSAGVECNYVVVTDPKDYTNASYELAYAPYHIANLSVMAPFVAAYRHAYVLTDYTPLQDEIGYLDPELNQRAIGIYTELKKMWQEYGPFEYIALVGSAASVPQFLLPDRTASDPTSCEGDGMVSSDVIYGFLDEDMETMDAAVGRLVNKNLQGLSNQLVRTFAYDRINPVKIITDSMGIKRQVEWRTHGSVWNGYEVADQRLQMTPGWFAKNDLQDEGYTYDYMRTTGNEGWRDAGTGKEVEFGPVMESSGYVFYRGHGSWHATFYVYEPTEYQDPALTLQYRDYIKDRLEGNASAYWPEAAEYLTSVIDMNLPPQIGVFVACENAKIMGGNWVNSPVDMRALFATNYLYAGAVGMVAATEVSFSNIGQDIDSSAEEYLPGVINKYWSDGDYEWDMNDFWFAAVVDGFLDHEDKLPTMGKVFQSAENRYLAFYMRERAPMGYPEEMHPLYQDPSNQYWENGPTRFLDKGRIVRMYAGAGAYWKEISMFALYGDPAFQPYSPNPGDNGYDPWHNGPEDNV